jgi:hypothetical protein
VRETQFTAAMAAVAADHERAVGRLKALMAATAQDEKLQVMTHPTRPDPISSCCAGLLDPLLAHSLLCR